MQYVTLWNIISRFITQSHYAMTNSIELRSISKEKTRL